MSRQDITREAKITKRQSLEADGVSVHPYSFNKTHMVEQARDAMGDVITTAGRIMNKREHGKVCFLQLQDHSGQIQIMVKEDGIGQEKYRQLIELIDPSDFLGVSGTVITTKTGEVTVEANSIEILSKALRAVPSSFQGIDDKEVRFRKRYLDLLIDSNVKKVIDARFLIEKEIRRYLQDVHSFVEVETPVLQPLYGGTNAKPFTTHMNALDSDFFLRIAPELYLKRLIVGGYERVFEIARNFRNEGIDQTHQPEFTMIEWYHAYADYTVMMDTAEGMIKHLAEKVNGNLNLTVGEVDIDLSGTWPRIRMIDAIKQHLDLDIRQWTDEQYETFLKEKSLELTGSFSRGKAIFAIFDKLVTSFLINPTWIIDYPKEVSPLAKQHRRDDGFVERYELYVGTKEMADGWSEVTDALEQRARFENEQKNMREGDSEAQPLDEDFLEAMEYGMPPLGGIGIGIDRLVMFLTNTWSIKEVIAFPTLRPTEEQVRMTEIMLGKKKTSNQTPNVVEKKSDLQKHASSEGRKVLPLSREKAVHLLESLVENRGLRGHMYAVEAAMGGLWEHFSKEQPDAVAESKESWELVGLLHDADWEKTESTPDQHTRYLTQELTKLKVEDSWSDSIRSHNFEHLDGQRQPETLMEWSLYACDHMTGIVVACALVSPEKKLASVPLERVMKKFKEKSFAKGATRDEILSGIEHLGISLETLASIVLSAMQVKASNIGL
jgi:lysyl-tRNA synthetase class 2